MPHPVRSRTHSYYINYNAFKQNIIQELYSIAKNQSICTNSSVLGAQVNSTVSSIQHELVIRNV